MTESMPDARRKVLSVEANSFFPLGIAFFWLLFARVHRGLVSVLSMHPRDRAYVRRDFGLSPLPASERTQLRSPQSFGIIILVLRPPAGLPPIREFDAWRPG